MSNIARSKSFQQPSLLTNKSFDTFIDPVLEESAADFEVQNHGTIFLLRPLTEAANAWVDEFLPEDALTFGNGICVEHRFIADIVRGIQSSDLVVR
jgi:hypothetical protein